MKIQTKTILTADNGSEFHIHDHKPVAGTWVWAEDLAVYIMQHTRETPYAFCLGDRMVHTDPGTHTHGVSLRGSTYGDWHGKSFDYLDFKAAVAWVKGTVVPELKQLLWNGMPDEGTIDKIKKGIF